MRNPTLTPSFSAAPIAAEFSTVLCCLPHAVLHGNFEITVYHSYDDAMGFFISHPDFALFRVHIYKPNPYCIEVNSSFAQLTP